jgi:hypothetical protein
LPGATGAAGQNGSGGGFIWPEIYGEDSYPLLPAPTPGPQGASGSNGVNGSPGFDGDPGDDGMPIPGNQGQPGATGAAGQNGSGGGFIWPEIYGEDSYPLLPSNIQTATPAAVQTIVVADSFIWPEIQPDEVYPLFPQALAPGPALGFAGGFTANTVINDTVTFTTGGATLTNQIALAGSVWRIRAHGTFTAVSSATARNAQMAAFWGATQLPGTATVVLVSTAQLTTWQAEIILSASSTTAVWTTGFFDGNTQSVAVARVQNNIAPATTTVTAGAQTIDLRFAMSAAVAGDIWTIQNVTIERLK